MAREASRKTINQPVDEAADSRARALSVLELLLSAQASAEIHVVDKACMTRLDKCVERLRAIHELSRSEIDGDPVSVESSLPGLLRLLVYLQAEAADGLRDAICATHLQECVTALLRAHRISPDRLYSGERQSCH
jgi:predicted NAD/FAD-dependent oxidoreductase